MNLPAVQIVELSDTYIIPIKMKSAISILSAAAIALAASACSQGGDGKPQSAGVADVENVDLRLTQVSGTTLQESTDSALASTPYGLVKVTVSALLPEKINNLDIKPLRDSLVSLAGIDTIRAHRCTPSPVDSTWRITTRKADTELYSSNRVSVESLNNRVIVFRADYESYLGGAHGLYNTQYLNFSLTDGKILSLNDLFVPGYEPRLKAVLTQNIPAGITLLTPPAQADVPDNFTIGDYYITFYYGLYEIAPYSDGIVAVRLYVQQLKGLLKPGSAKYFAPAL